MKFSHIIKNVVSSFVFALLPLSASAKCGNVDYSWGADALAGMHDYVVTMMLYVLYLTYAVAAVMVIISALQIYIKMNTGEDGVTKSILTLIGASLFMIGASILFPAFFWLPDLRLNCRRVYHVKATTPFYIIIIRCCQTNH